MWRPLALGFVTGMRSQLPTALLAWRRSRGDLPSSMKGPARLFERRGALPLLLLAAAGELVGDKLPVVPSRLQAGPLGGRLVLGANAGASIAGATDRSQVSGAVLGMAGAGLGAWAGARYRALAAERTSVPDAMWAVAEDAVAIGVGLAATDVDS